MMRQSRSLKIPASLFAAGLLLSFALIAAAQSGRRVTKSPQTTSPPAAPTTAPVAARPSPEKPVATLLVGLDKSDIFSPIRLSAMSGVLHSCVDRLNDSASLKVIMESQSMSRSDALKKAKAGSEGQHVVWLQIGVDRVSASQGARVDPHDIFIEFIVFAPTTAKIFASGRTYPQAHRHSGIPSARTGGIYGDYLYNQAAKEAAERILRAFHIPTRPVPGS